MSNFGKLSSILLVDDDSITNYLHKFLITQKMGFQGNLQICTNGKDAINYLNSIDDQVKYPDLILLDINMPVMNGFEFLGQYNELYSKYKTGIVVCMLTSSLSSVDKQRAMNFEDLKKFITKPLKEELLQELLDEFF